MKTVIIVDYHHYCKVQDELNIMHNAEGLLSFLKSVCEDGDNDKIIAYAYIGKDEKSPHSKDRVADELWRAGYIVREVILDRYGIYDAMDASQQITLDILRSHYEEKIDNAIFVTNSAKISDLIVFLKERGVYTVNVFYDSFVDYDSSIKADGFIGLEKFIKDDDDPMIEQDDYESTEDDCYTDSIPCSSEETTTIPSDENTDRFQENSQENISESDLENDSHILIPCNEDQDKINHSFDDKQNVISEYIADDSHLRKDS